MNAMKTKPTLTVALSNHRPEIIPLAVGTMRRHALIVLEEPPAAEFVAMLAGDIPVDDYLLGVDTEYPEFGRRMCRVLQALHRKGFHVVQVEPFLEKLIRIHERLGDGLRPSDLETDSDLWPVYEAERQATRALIRFYEAAAKGDFEDLLSSVKAFARKDAERFVLRDRLRAQAIAVAAVGYDNVYVEAGQMHVGLAQAIRRVVGARFRVTPDFLLSEVMSSMGGPGSLFGPGDILTLLYRFNPGFDGPLANLLAARALVQNKIITKEEIADEAEDFPHTRDEVEANRLVRNLSLADCRRLLPAISTIGAPKARRLVGETAGQTGGLNLPASPYGSKQ